MRKPLREIKGARSGIVALFVWIASSIISVSDGIKEGKVTTVGEAFYEILISMILAAIVWVTVHVIHEILAAPRMSEEEFMKFLRRH